MIGTVLDTVVPWRMRRLRFDAQVGEDARDNTTAIVEAFLAGARGGFRRHNEMALGETELGLPWFRRPFHWEGVAFGLAGRFACRVGSQPATPSTWFRDDGYRFMFFTGVGFWNGVAARYRAPMVPLDPEAWRAVPDFEGKLPLLAGGMAFGLVAAHGRFDAGVIACMDRLGDVWFRHGLRQGVGRALWFLHMGDLPRIIKILVDAGEDGIAMAEGLGIALCYTQLPWPERIVPSVEALPEPFAGAARAGARLALGAALDDEPTLADRLAALPPPLPDWLRIGTDALASSDPGPRLAQDLRTALYDADRN